MGGIGSATTVIQSMINHIVDGLKLGYPPFNMIVNQIAGSYFNPESVIILLVPGAKTLPVTK